MSTISAARGPAAKGNEQRDLPGAQGEALAKKVADPKKAQQKAQAEQVAKEFETIFLELMLKSMRDTARSEDESNATNIFQGMLDSEYAKGMAEVQSFGVRDMILGWMQTADPELLGAGAQDAQKEMTSLKNSKATEYLKNKV